MKVIFAFFLNIAFNFIVGLLVAKFLGPAEFGRFALAFATAIVVQTAFLDWLRLGATPARSSRQPFRPTYPLSTGTLRPAAAAATAGASSGSTGASVRSMSPSIADTGTPLR